MCFWCVYVCVCACVLFRPVWRIRILLGLKKPRDYDDDSVDYVFDRANEQRRDRVRSDDAQRGPHHTSVTAPSSRAAVVRTDAGGGSSGRRSWSATNRWNNATSPPAREAGERWSEYVARWNEEEDEMTLRAFEASLEHENDASDDEAAANHRLASPFGDERSPVPREDTRGARGHQRSPNTSNTPSPLPASPLTYRPSPKDRTVSRQQRGDELWPTDEEEEEALRMLGVSPREWEDGPDLLREWISERLLRPLRRVCENSHAALSSALLSLASADEWERRFGLSVPLPPLGEDGDGGAFGSAVGTDLDSALLAVKTLLQQQMKQQHMQQQQQLSARALQALNTHLHLLYLLRGEYPSHLMAPMPPNYAMQKIRDLSEGTCCAAFTWDSGAAWGSRVHIWKDALPSDTHLIIYLFLAYIHSYGWSFPVDPTSGTDVPYGLQGSLFVGELPVMPSSSSSQAGRSGRGPYTAVLPVRPAEAVSEAFVLVCSPSTHPPQISVVEEDKLLMVLSGHSAAFRTIVLIIARARAMYGGALGLGMNIDSEFTQLFEGSFRLD